MIIQISFKVESIEKAKQFYIDELGIFKEITSFGENAVLIGECKEGNLELYLELGKTEDLNNEPAFSFEVEDCSKEFERIKNIHFLSGDVCTRRKAKVNQRFLNILLGKIFY